MDDKLKIDLVIFNRIMGRHIYNDDDGFFREATPNIIISNIKIYDEIHENGIVDLIYLGKNDQKVPFNIIISKDRNITIRIFPAEELGLVDFEINSPRFKECVDNIIAGIRHLFEHLNT